MSKFLTLEGLKYYQGKLEAVFSSSLSIADNALTLKSKSGQELATVQLPRYEIPLASATVAGKMSPEHFKKLEAIAQGATKTQGSSTNGNVIIDGKEVQVYKHPTATAQSAGLYKVTVDALGHVSVATLVTKADVTALGIPGQDTTYSAAVAGGAAGLMTGADKTKLDGIAAGAQVNALEGVVVDGALLPISGKRVSIDLSKYALKSDVAAVVQWRGNVDTFEKLPTDPHNGDFYNVVASFTLNGQVWPAGSNVIWNETTKAWDPVSGLFEVHGIENAEIDGVFA